LEENITNQKRKNHNQEEWLEHLRQVVVNLALTPGRMNYITRPKRPRNFEGFYFGNRLHTLITLLDDLGYVVRTPGNGLKQQSATVQAKYEFHLRLRRQYGITPGSILIYDKNGSEVEYTDTDGNEIDWEDYVHKRFVYKRNLSMINEFRNFCDIRFCASPDQCRELAGNPDYLGPNTALTRYKRIFKDAPTWYGRFHGHWGQNLPNQLIKYIKFGTTPPAVLDFVAMFPNLVYAKNMLDPLVGMYDISGVPREIVKGMLLRIWGNDGENALKKSWQRYLGNDVLVVEYGTLLFQHRPILFEEVDGETWRDLSFYESCIAERIMVNLAVEGIPFICKHDGFIIPQDKVGAVEKIMTHAWRMEMDAQGWLCCDPLIKVERYDT